MFQNIKQLLTQNKPVMIGLIFIGIVLLLAIFAGGDARRAPLSDTPLPSTTRLEIIDLNEQKRRQAADYRKQIMSVLPIYLSGFRTSVGIETTINLYFLDDDPVEVVRLEIYGLSYLNSDSDRQKNPNVTAFAESYQEAMKRLRDKGIDPKKLIFIYGDKEYVRKTSERWLDDLNLQP